MKHVAVTFAVISFLPCLGAGEENAQPMTSPYHQLQFTQPISEFEAQPDPEKHGDASHSTSNVRVTPKLRRHKHAKYRANIGRTRSEMESRSVHRGTWSKPSLTSFPVPRYALALQRQPDDEAYWRRIESFDAYEEPCRPWWKWVLPWKNNQNPKTGIDIQDLSVLNQSPGGQHSFVSRDLSASVVARDWDFWETPPDDVPRSATFSVLHEPAFGLIASIHFRDPSDMTNAPAQTRDLTIHPLLAGQVDLLNLSFEQKLHPKYPWPELKLTIAPQLDLYGRFTGKDAQFQWPLQPSVEWHFCERLSAVFQVSVPLFTAGGRNPPPSFAIGILWNAEGGIPW